MSGVNNPHDSYFVKSIGNEESIREFLELNLPDEIIENLKMDTISKENTSFVDQNLKRFFSDLIFKVDLKSGNKGYVVFLLEHKSTDEKEPVFQIFKYLARIWDEVITDSKLPVIIPILFYHGKEKWTAPVRLSGLMEGDISWAAKIIPDFSYYVYTLNDLKEIYPHITVTKLKLYIKALQLSRSKTEEEFYRILENLLIELNRYCLEKGENAYFITTMTYIMETCGKSKSDQEKIIEQSKKFVPERKGDIMTVAEELRKEGEERGIVKGIEQGIEKGRIENMQEMIDFALELKFGLVSKKVTDKINGIKNYEKLKEIKKLIVIAGTIEEFMKKIDM